MGLLVEGQRLTDLMKHLAVWMQTGLLMVR